MDSQMTEGKVAEVKPRKAGRQGGRLGYPILILRNVFGSLTLAAALMAMMNVETIRQAYSWNAHSNVKTELAVRRAKAVVTSHTESKGRDIAQEWQTTLTQDELNSVNPYASLISTEPLDRIKAAGVVHFQRETLRSPTYQGLNGYDMVYYDIEQKDHSHSTILAYLEGGKTPFVIVRLQDQSASRYFFFRDGMLVPQSQLTAGEVEAMINTRLRSGIPFLTVSR